MSAQEPLPIITLDITPDTAPAIFRGAGLGQYFEHIRASVNEAPDLSTKRGRDRIASLAAQVSRSKTAVERPGREYLKSIKALPRLIETELREFADMCDDLRDEVRRPLTEWEAEQARIEDERKAAEAAAALALQVDADHEIALLMDREIDHQREEARQAAEQAQREQAAEQARREADVQHKRAINTAAMRALVEHAGLTDEQAKAVIVAIARGQVGNVSIRY